MLHGVPAEDLPTVWPVVGPMLQAAIDRADGDYTLDDVAGWLDRRDWQLWVWITDDRITAACTTCILSHPRRRVCSVPLVGGSGLTAWWADGPGTIAAWAKAIGCDRMEGYDPRAGKLPAMAVWVRRLVGWRVVWATIRRDL